MLELKDTVLLSVAAEKTGRSVEDLLMEYDLPVYYWLDWRYLARTPFELMKPGPGVHPPGGIEPAPERRARCLRPEQRIAIAQRNKVTVEPVKYFRASVPPPWEITRDALYLRRKDVAKLKEGTPERKTAVKKGRRSSKKNIAATKHALELVRQGYDKNSAAELAAKKHRVNANTIRRYI